MAITKWSSEERTKSAFPCCKIRLYLILTISKIDYMRAIAEVLMTETNKKALKK